MKKENIEQKKSLEAFFAKPYVLIFACILLLAASLKAIFIFSTAAATGTWKVILVADTITAFLCSASLFVFHMAGDGKSHEGVLISSITFIVASVASIVTQFFVITYFAAFDNIGILLLTIICFSVQSVFQLIFAININKNARKKTLSAKGAAAFAAVKAFSIVAAVLLYFTESTTINTTLFKTPFESSNKLNTNYPDAAFYGIIITSLVLSAFALLYQKYADSAKEENETTNNTD